MGSFCWWSERLIGKLGGHAAVADKVLEDVELAFLAKRRKVGLRFRYAEDAVATRMYRTTAAMIEGWTKNLALLFNNALALALWRALDIFLLVGLPWLAIELWSARFAVHSLEWLGAGWVLAVALGAQPVPVLLRELRNRIFQLWTAPCLRWDCRCLCGCCTEAGFSTGY